MSEIDRVISRLWGGSSRAAQEELGVTRAAISKWRVKGIPKLRRYQFRAIADQRKKSAARIKR